MTTKEYLMQYRVVNHQISEHLEEIERLRAKSTRITSNATGMPRSGRKSDFTIFADRIIDLMGVMDERTRELQRIGVICEKAISAMPDAMEQRCLWMRYINGYNWNKIARRLGYSRDGIFKLHRRALEHIRIEGDECGDPGNRDGV